MATATGIPQEQAKKRKGAPSTNEIFSEPVAGPTSPTVINGHRLQTGAKRVHLNPHKQVSYPPGDCPLGGVGVAQLNRPLELRLADMDAAYHCSHIHCAFLLYTIVSNWKEQYRHLG